MVSPASAVDAVLRWLGPRSLGRASIVAIDGGGGAGKSTLARAIARAVTDRPATVVHVDDFYLPSAQRPHPSLRGLDVDFARLRAQALEPLRGGVMARYQRYDWKSDALAEWREITPQGLVSLEGVGAAALSVRDAVDLILWVECPAEERLRRGLRRDGEAARPLWLNKWLPAEERYLATEQPDGAADCIVDGGGGEASAAP